MARKNHRWLPVLDTLNQRVEQCVICNVFRNWVGAEYQGWYYRKVSQRDGTFIRPECKTQEN